MNSKYNEKWEEKKWFLTQSFFRDVSVLTTVQENDESTRSKHSDNIPLQPNRSRCSTLPDLIIERVKKVRPYDETEEFYDKLYKKVKRYIKKLDEEDSPILSDSSRDTSIVQFENSNREPTQQFETNLEVDSPLDTVVDEYTLQTDELNESNSEFTEREETENQPSDDCEETMTKSGEEIYEFQASEYSNVDTDETSTESSHHTNEHIRFDFSDYDLPSKVSTFYKSNQTQNTSSSTSDITEAIITQTEAEVHTQMDTIVTRNTPVPQNDIDSDAEDEITNESDKKNIDEESESHTVEQTSSDKSVNEIRNTSTPAKRKRKIDEISQSDIEESVKEDRNENQELELESDEVENNNQEHEEPEIMRERATIQNRNSFDSLEHRDTSSCNSQTFTEKGSRGQWFRNFSTSTQSSLHYESIFHSFSPPKITKKDKCTQTSIASTQSASSSKWAKFTKKFFKGETIIIRLDIV